jgi:hypothetical protein
LLTCHTDHKRTIDTNAYIQDFNFIIIFSLVRDEQGQRITIQMAANHNLIPTEDGYCMDDPLYVLGLCRECGHTLVAIPSPKTGPIHCVQCICADGRYCAGHPSPPVLPIPLDKLGNEVPVQKFPCPHGKEYSEQTIRKVTRNTKETNDKVRRYWTDLVPKMFFGRHKAEFAQFFCDCYMPQESKPRVVAEHPTPKPVRPPLNPQKLSTFDKKLLKFQKEVLLPRAA